MAGATKKIDVLRHQPQNEISVLWLRPQNTVFFLQRQPQKIILFINVIESCRCFRRSCTTHNLLFDLDLNLLGQFGIVGQKLLGGIAALRDFGTVVAIPGATLLDDVVVYPQVYNFPVFGDTLPEGDIKLRHAERWGQLIFDNLHLDVVARDVAILVFDTRAGAADIQSDRRIKLQPGDDPRG